MVTSVPAGLDRRRGSGPSRCSGDAPRDGDVEPGGLERRRRQPRTAGRRRSGSRRLRARSTPASAIVVPFGDLRAAAAGIGVDHLARGHGVVRPSARPSPEKPAVWSVVCACDLVLAAHVGHRDQRLRGDGRPRPRCPCRPSCPRPGVIGEHRARTAWSARLLSARCRPTSPSFVELRAAPLRTVWPDDVRNRHLAGAHREHDRCVPSRACSPASGRCSIDRVDRARR